LGTFEAKTVENGSFGADRKAVMSGDAEPVELHSTDIKALTAKAVLYRTILRYEADKSHARLRDRKNLLSTLVSTTQLFPMDDNQVEIPQILELFSHTLEVLLKASIYRDLADDIVTAFREEAKDYGSIKEELDSWLKAMLTYSDRYLEPSLSGQPYLLLGAPEYCKPPLSLTISGVTHSVASGRRITIFLQPRPLDSDTYFEIPGLISHEFWCHSLGNTSEMPTGAAPWNGCDPDDSWEEGWMDFVQNMIIRACDFPYPPRCPPWLIPAFEQASTRYAFSRANPANGVERSRGWAAALHAQRFLRQRFADGDDIFIDVSLKVNAISGISAKKRSLVELFFGYLAFPVQDQSVQASLDQLVTGRERLMDVIKPTLLPDSSGRLRIDVGRILKATEDSL
jgi:hypothetical protein